MLPCSRQADDDLDNAVALAQHADTAQALEQGLELLPIMHGGQ